jgi:hypothetical protein
VEAIWVIKPTYYRHLLQQTQNSQLEKIVAFSCAILHWALLSLHSGHELNFEAQRFSPTYEKALLRLTALRDGRASAEEQVLMNTFLSNIWAHGGELLANYSVN